jgi:hypothetical protein
VANGPLLSPLANPPTVLFSISISLGGADTNAGLGHFYLSLYNDAGGIPGGNLATLSGNNFPTNIGIYTYTNASPLTLLPNTTYWIVSSSPDSTNNGYILNVCPNNTVDSSSFWTLGLTNFSYFGGIFYPDVFNYSQFSVAVLPPAAPGIAIFQPIVLTYTTPGFPFVLQQNSNLATTNWVNATNAIQISTVNNNQTVFIAPPNGQQMFYRLSLQ